jgi:streptomycin 6-kinase
MKLVRFSIPPALGWLEQRDPAWLRELPARVERCARKWSLTLEEPYLQSFVSVVFPATFAHASVALHGAVLGEHGADAILNMRGAQAVLKIQWPHPESDHEHEALRAWNGNGAVQLYDYDAEEHALLLERCEPGDHLSTVGADEALDVLTEMLPRLWVPAGAPFRTVTDECAMWRERLPADWELAGRPFERALLDAALEAMDHLSRTQTEQVLVHQDLHGDNVLRAQRQPWLAIDPKPLVGEREFSLAPIIRSYEFGHSCEAVIHRLDHLTNALNLDRERARLWCLAQTLAWAFEGAIVYEKHVETARWLWKA